MNLKNLNVGIANLVENNGRLELELYEEREQSKNYREWWQKANVENENLKKDLDKLQKDFVEYDKINGNKKIKDLIAHFKLLQKTQSAAMIEDVLLKLNSYAKKDA